MAELSALLGSVLKELAQARYMADSYSCTLSELYESNAALRMFPVPRAEIEEAEFTLRFAVTDLVRAEGKFRDKVKEILNRQATIIGKSVLNELAGLDVPNWREAVAEFRTAGTEDLHRAIVAGLLEGMMPLVSEGLSRGSTLSSLAGRLNRTELADAVGGRVRRWLTGFGAVRAALAAMEGHRPVKEAIAQALHAPLEGVLDELGNVELEDLYALDIDVASEKLSDLPAEATTSLTIKLAVRNYVWASVEGERDDDGYRILGPE
ncbi:MAG: hypothetical protein OXK77_17260 [Gemmatimonadota bacterium]|nr:hypothetical protein [Gemmatimonadota bacterium]MDE2865058.1 hypothetical protein [Gemmatimonadota bacterium]